MVLCARCGAAPSAADATCRYCGAPIEGRGELLSAPDLRRLSWPDWQLYPQVARFGAGPGPVPELLAEHAYEGPPRATSLLASNGSFVDVDVAVSIRFAWPPNHGQEAGVKLRATNAAHLYAKITSRGSANVELCDRVAGRATLLVPWVKAHAGAGPEDRVRLRIVARGPDLRLWIDGALVATAQHGAVWSGQVHLCVTQASGTAQVAFSDLVLRAP